ncbi:CoA transferase subunit A [Fusibacter paucivorans]|uniref:CoA transferase subunit A n=1 Tax=Fusibacter paucivorans TaxID=76009 RepID=A0ABS5PJT3_9FIRM|nr:CoA transferase subunit A [Fusibacter paucivorans]MBS7525398.1 CoA transferase subunit A [Fusibacter paucivorans]
MAEVKTVQECASMVADGASVMVGGFLGVGAPLQMIDQLVANGTKELTLISVVGSYPGGGFDIGKLTAGKQVKKFIGAHIGTDPALVSGYNTGEIDVEFNPMGTFIERIRAAGAGLGAVVTPVGIGTEVEENASKQSFYGKDYLVFPPLGADFAIIKAKKADHYGNLCYDGTSMNTNTTMATAGKVVIAEVDEIVEVGTLAPNEIGTPGIFVDYIVKGFSTDERKAIFGEIWQKGNKLK